MKKINLIKLQNKLLIVLGVIVIILGILNLIKDNPLNLEKECILRDGKWLEEYKECEGISLESCEELRGTFNECASACRHTNSEFCIMLCVPVCSFN